MDNIFQRIFKEALKEGLPNLKKVTNEIDKNNYIFEVSGSKPIKKDEIENVLEEARTKLDIEGLFSGGVILKTLSGIHQEEGYDKEVISRIHLIHLQNEEDLKKHKQEQDEAEQKDHRVIGKEMNLWSFSSLIGEGLPLFTPRGTAIRNALLDALVKISKEYGMQPVSIPHIAKRALYDVSGHSQKFGDELIKVVGHYDEFVMKPVNCPHHTQIFAASQPRSYRDLPVRYMESTMQYRDEQPGELMGLSRVRAITVDDGHIFCRVEQIKQEVKNIATIIETFYKNLGLWGKHRVSLSVRDPQNLENYIGEDMDWQKAEQTLQEISDELGLNAEKCEGEAAIYGPKLDYQFTDSLRREWQLATVQIDFSLPKRFELSYTNEKGEKEVPVMIHRAILGSYERFLAIILEHFGGWLPYWLAPVQIVVLPVSQKQEEYAQAICSSFLEKNIRCETMGGNTTLGKRIKQTKLIRTPFIIVVGDDEVTEGKIDLQNNKQGEKVYKDTPEGVVKYLQTKQF